MKKSSLFVERIPIIIDVDTGTDDALAVMAALRHSAVLDIKAITTVFGNVSLEKASKNTLNLLRCLGFPIVVAKGASKPMVSDQAVLAISHGVSGLGDVVLPEAKQIFSPIAAPDLIYEIAKTCNGELQILAVGPLTNIACALAQYPDLAALIKCITIMGGGLCGGNITMGAEFNIYNDPEAADLVFTAGVPLTMVGLNVTLHPKIYPEFVEGMKGIRNPFANIANVIIDFMLRRKDEIGGDPPNFHDVIALAAIVAPELLEFKDYYMRVETAGEHTRGMTVADFNNAENKAANVSAAVAIDVSAFWAWFLATFRD